MNEFVELEQFLLTDPREVSCDETLADLHVCVELVAASEDTAALYPGIAAHLAACGPCGDDFAGLIAAVTGKQSRWRSRKLGRPVTVDHWGTTMATDPTGKTAAP